MHATWLRAGILARSKEMTEASSKIEEERKEKKKEAEIEILDKIKE